MAGAVDHVLASAIEGQASSLRCRHGGILSNSFIDFWWNRQVVTNQYGRHGRKNRKWGEDTIEGDLDEQGLLTNRNDQNLDNAVNSFRDDEYYASKEYSMEDIRVPLLSVANWGGILLHLRGNVIGYMNSGSSLKYLRFITGRHDLPFYYKEDVELQRSFMDSFLKGDDRECWSTGKAPAVDLVLRNEDVGFNDAEAERAYPRRTESEWPIARTKYTPYFLTPDKNLSTKKPKLTSTAQTSYDALGTLENPLLIQFSTLPVEHPTEITGHIVVHLNVSVNAYIGAALPKDIDLFLTLRYFLNDKEVFYTGAAGDPVPLWKGWLRVSLRKVNTSHVRHRDYLPYRDYFTSYVLPVLPGEVYSVDVEMWPTNVVMEPGSRLVLEVSSGDTQGSGVFTHTGAQDRRKEHLAGRNHINFGPHYDNYITLPIIPQKSSE